jgi:hypothetical protein
LKKTIHTTLSNEIHAWLNKEAERANCPLNEVVEKMVVFYQKNQELPEKFISARFFLKQVIKEELAANELIKKSLPAHSILHNTIIYKITDQSKKKE